MQSSERFDAEIAKYSASYSKHKKFLRRATKDDFMYDGSFHEAVGPALVLGQCFGIMPVKGVKSKDANGLSFSWTYIPAIYSILMLIALTLFFCLTLIRTLSHKFKLDNIGTIVFYGSTVLILYSFGSLARKWPELMRKWDHIERKLPKYQSQMEKAALAHKIKMITLVITVLSLTEHLLSIISNVHFANYCNIAKNPIKSFFLTELPEIFFVTSFATWKAILGKTLNIVATFVWNFMNVFVMIVGVGLSEKFRQLNHSMFRHKGKVMPESFWRDHRNHYRNLCILCEEVDSALSVITMVSLSNNLYFICAQLLKTLNELPSFGHYLYFWFSLIYLIGRTLALSLYSAEINDESKRPIEVFRSVPSESWCLEVKRFSAEVNSETVALSAMRFFYLTRKLVLNVAGTIITYELVLIQYNYDEKITGC